jgi:L-cysteine:1D-myo-inositol 2-amino-2-deoxy-alpha-D-glucopyranoside ligase
MKFYDTNQKELVDFAVTAGQEVRIYVCGITPYDSAHLGHIFTFMTYDLLSRRLQELGATVKMVRNITDVDEPIYKKAAQMGIPYTELAEKETQSFQKTLAKLNFMPASAEPKASEYIQQMAVAVKEMLREGVAYKLDEDIYFDVHKIEGFGRLSGFSHKLQLNFMHLRGGDPDRPGKHNPLDFLLWKGVTDTNDPAAWDSPVGYGRPGWHIECTVMSSELLGLPFDIHGGGSDLIYPHHEAENAQSSALGYGCPAKYWLHVSPMLFAGEKMSKSLGNLVFAKDLLGHYSAGAIRLALMRYHYRTGGEWRHEYLEESEQLLTRIKYVMQHAPAKDSRELLRSIRELLDNDLNMPYIAFLMRQYVKNCAHCCKDKTGEDTDPEAVQAVLSLLGLE